MHQRNLFILFSLALWAVLPASAQQTKAELSVVPGNVKDKFSLLKKIRNSKADTQQVNLLIHLSRVYWHNITPGRKELDTLLMTAKKAQALSKKLNYDKGLVESTFLICKTYTRTDRPDDAKKLMAVVKGQGRIQILLAIAEYFTFNFDSHTNEFAEASPLIAQAIKIAEEIHAKEWLVECQILIGKYYFRKGEIKQGRKAFMVAINSYQKVNNFAQAARVWSNLGNSMPEDNNTFAQIKKSHEMAIKNFALAGERENLAYSLRDLGLLNGNHQQTDSAERQLLRVIDILEELNKPVKFTTYFIIGDFYRFSGKNDRALFYALEASRTTDLDARKKGMLDMLLASIYGSLGEKKKSLSYYRQAFDYQEPLGQKLMYVTAYYVADLLSQTGRPRDAVMFLQDFIKKRPDLTANRRQLYASVYANSYAALGEYRKAEFHYKRMLDQDEAVAREIGKDIENNHITLVGSGANFLMAKFYIQRKRFAEAKVFLLKSIKNPQYIDSQQSLDTYLYLFKADSALKNYLPAIKNFARYKMLNDSLNSTIRSKQISELSIKYQTQQNENQIKLLQNRQKLQQSEISRADTLRRITLFGSAMFFLFGALAYTGYINKQRSNRKLKLKQQEINQQNHTLSSLLSEKDNFLKEKDWLLKEIHHRVKNNLQIIMSLLATQSVFLKNDDALEAIQDSQHRVQSIALIHQKLYSGENLTNINMREYISDLVRHLADGFDSSRKNIAFHQSIDKIFIDLAQAVPLGLILNEAITNAIKYAFTPSGGTIHISLRKTQGDMVTLTIKDDGSGLPENLDIQTAGSLGMEMMRGLSKQIKGSFDICSEKGTCIVIAFKLMTSLPSTLQ